MIITKELIEEFCAFLEQKESQQCKEKPYSMEDLQAAYKNGAEIQYYSEFYKQWCDSYSPLWSPEYAYRIKPLKSSKCLGCRGSKQ